MRLHVCALFLLLLMQRPGGATLGRCRGESAEKHAIRAPQAWCEGLLQAAVSPAAMTLRGGKEQRWAGGVQRGRVPSPHGGGMRGGIARRRGGGARGPPKLGLVGGGVDVKKRLQDKLRTLGERRKILNDYESKWAAENEEQEREKEAAAQRSKGTKDLWNRAPKGTHTKLGQDMEDQEDQEAEDDDGEHTEETDAGETMDDSGEDLQTHSVLGAPSKPDLNSTAASGGGTATSPDSLLRELNRTGLCLKGDLDARVETFIIKLKKEGKRKALVAALVQFREHLLRPQSHGR